MLDYQQKMHRRNDALFVLNTCISLDYCIIPTRYLLGRRVVSFRVPDDALHTHSNVRDEERPSAFGRSGLRLGWFCCHTSLNCTGTFYIINRAGHKLFSIFLSIISTVSRVNRRKRIADLLRHLIHRDAVIPADPPFLRIVLPWREDQHAP